MIKKLPLYIIFLSVGGLVYALTVALPQDKGFKQRVDDFIRQYSAPEETTVVIDTAPSGSILDRYYDRSGYFSEKEDSINYSSGDWNRHVLYPDYRSFEERKGVMLYGERNDDVNILSYGSMKFNLSYGDSVFTDNKYKSYDEDRPASQVLRSGFVPEQELLLHMEGNIGRRLTVYIDHDSRKEDNQYLMQYRAIRDDEVIREINAGMIDIKFNHSHYAVYDNSTAKGMGLDMTLKKKNFQIKAFASIMRGESEVEYFKGNSSPGSYKLMEYQYLSKRHYQLEPFRRYDGIINRAALPDNETAFYNLVTFTSSPTSSAQYSPNAVNISSSGFELYLDDQDGYNNYNAIQLSVDGGYYTKLQSGRDYSINYATGLISFIRDIPEKARIFAVYNTDSGTTTSDPSARTDVAEFPGRLFVFLKYGASMEESVSSYASFPFQPVSDLNGDGVCNLDIYEVRSYYYIGDVNILSDNFTLTFFHENSVMSSRDVSGKRELDSIGPYTVNYTKGLIIFNLREPFKYLLTQMGTAEAGRVYCENQQDNIYEYSKYRIRVDYYRDARTFQLKHFNIIPDSVTVKINGAELSKTLYSVDYTSGYLVFSDPNNPYINSETDIEIRYEYLPLDGQTNSFVGGIRADYAVTENLNLGGSVLYAKSSTGETIPDVDNAPTQTTLLEGDALLSLDEKAFKKIGKFLTKKETKRVPIEFKAYGEYARSYKDVNTFGKALIDSMDTSDDSVSLSMSEKDWILASMPSGATQADRAMLNYYYYRNPSDPEKLYGLSFSPKQISYSVKPGPFNVATGHVDTSLLSSSSQISMVMDFDFSSGDYASIVTRKLTSTSVDLSGLQYVEIWYRYEGEATTDSLDFFLDIGSINEDSDGDGSLDTEDSNYNGYIDSDPDSGYSEDRGYEFNGNNTTRVGSGPKLSSATRGDGILNSEDINKNGVLDASENAYSVPGTNTSPASLSLGATGSTWQRARIYIDPSSLSLSEIETLKDAEAVRLTVRRNAANVGTGGRLFIDTIKFVSSRWSNLFLGTDVDDPTAGVSTGPDNLSVTIVSSLSDSDYRSSAFLFSQKKLYKSLYGDKDNDELKKETECSLKVDYNIPASNPNASFTQNFSQPMDLRFYKTMNLWLNYRSAPSGDMGIIIGSSDSDYRLYRFTIDQQQVWKEVRLKLKSGSSGSVGVYSETGNVDMKRISYIKVVVFDPGGSGTFWLNDIYLSDPETLEDDAYWVESEIKVTEPLFKTKKGTPVFSDLYLKYLRKAHGSQFSTVAKTVSDMSEEYDEVYTSFNVLPRWSTSVSYIREKTRTDSLNEDVSESMRGETLKNSVYCVTDYASDRSAVPVVHLSYKYDDYDNDLNDSITDYLVRRNTVQDNHALSIGITESIDNFLWGKINIKVLLDMVYKNETISRKSSELDDDDLASLVSLEENEKRQKTSTDISLDYQCKAFYLKPQISFGSQEIVTLDGKSTVNDTEINGNVGGDYHFPYDYTGDFKFVERDKKGSIVLGTNYWKYFTPSYIFNIQYQENKFSDYTSSDDAGRFTRERDSRSTISTQLVFPVNFYAIEKIKYLKNISLSYGRSVYCYESNVPYEGESLDFYEERFGPKRSIRKLLGAGMNIFEYYPFFSFLGRGNFGNGRDYVYRTLNKSILYPDKDVVSDYDNQLRLIENFALNWTLDLDKVVIDSGGGLDQICERQNILGVPQQTVSWNVNINLNFDLMKLFKFGFFRPNREGIAYHASTFQLGYTYENNMIITSNIDEHVHSPLVGITFKWDRASIGVNFSVDFRRKNSKQFIEVDDSGRAAEDDIYYENMSEYVNFHEQDEGYNLSFAYETDVKWVYNIFAKFYRLTAFPIYKLEYSMKLNRYDYNKTVSPDPYDLHLIDSSLTLDLHKYIQGSFYSRFAIEQYRSRHNNSVNREIFSYELGLNFSLVF